jgi:hypothetical protein
VDLGPIRALVDRPVEQGLSRIINSSTRSARGAYGRRTVEPHPQKIPELCEAAYRAAVPFRISMHISTSFDLGAAAAVRLFHSSVEPPDV